MQKTEDAGCVVEVTAQELALLESPSEEAKVLASATSGNLLEIAQEEEDWLLAREGGWFRRDSDAFRRVKAVKVFHPDHAEHRIALIVVDDSEVLESVKMKLCEKTGLDSSKMVPVCAHRVPEEYQTGSLADYVNWQPAPPKATVTADLLDDTFRFVYFGNANDDLRSELKYDDQA